MFVSFVIVKFDFCLGDSLYVALAELELTM